MHAGAVGFMITDQDWKSKVANSHFWLLLLIPSQLESSRTRDKERTQTAVRKMQFLPSLVIFQLKRVQIHDRVNFPGWMDGWIDDSLARSLARSLDDHSNIKICWMLLLLLLLLLPLFIYFPSRCKFCLQPTWSTSFKVSKEKN